MINKINNINSNVEYNGNFGKSTSFKGIDTAVLSGLGWMKSNPALSACCVDICSMVIPRTVVETKNRGKQSGIETFIREFSSSFLHSMIGIIGFGAAALISQKFNKENNIKAQKIFASGDTIQNMSEIWKNSDGEAPKFFESFVKNLKGLNESNWNKISENSTSKITEDLIKLAQKTEELSTVTGDKKAQLKEEVKNIKNVILAKITKDTGAGATFKLNAINGSKEISASIGELVDSAVSLSNAFKTKAKEEFPEFVKKLMNNKKYSALLGIGICAAISTSIQPINRMLTKKRTGSDGFVGVDSKENDNSTGFNVLKTALGISFPIFAINTIPGKLKDLLSNVQFNGLTPRINQFKLIYGLTIGSRLMASRDSNELRESMIKDTLGFCTWLLFGDFVAKLISRATGGKELINNPVVQKGQNSLSYAKNWLMNSSVKSFDEILLPKAKEYIKDGKLLKLKELFKNAEPELKKQVIKAAGAQIAGYLFSGIVLGVGIAKLNIFITQKVHNRNKAKKQMNNEINKQAQSKNLNSEYLMQKTSSVFKEFK